MDGWGAGSSLCVMLGLAPSGPFFLVAPSVWLAGVGFERVGKGGSRVLTPDLVVMAKIVLVLDVFFNSVPPLLFGERVEVELSELIELHTVVRGYVIVKELYKKPFLYPVIGDLFDQVLEMDPGVFYGFVGPLSESEDHIS
ncbi:hypothetical protein Tco_0031843 [Tanacetum coccineum]